MIRHLVPALALSILFSGASCERKVVVVEVPAATPIPEPVSRTKTLETGRLGSAIDEYERQPTAVHSAEVDKAFADLDGELAELREYIAKHDGEEQAKAAAKLANMQNYRAEEKVRFTAAQAKGSVGIREPDARTGAEKVGDSARKVGNGIEDAAKKAGDAIKDIGR